jgi:acyl-CoA synthetase (NDP forming)
VNRKTNPVVEERTILDEHRSKLLLRQYGIPVVQEHPAEDEDAAVAAAQAIGFPVALKGMGPRLAHKTERGAVALNLADAQAVRSAAGRMRRALGADLESFLVQPHIGGQREFMAGVIRDPQFGPAVLFGLGGVLTEALDDVVLRLAPLSESEAQAMLDSIRATRLLGTLRGEAAVDRVALVRILTGLAQLALDDPAIAEIDINPLRITPRGEVLAVDALVVKAPPVAHRYPPAVSPEAVMAFFHPRRIAFIGASGQMGKWGHILVANTVGGGYDGEIFLVNPKGGRIAGRTVHSRIADLPSGIDLAVITLPADKMLELIPQLAAKQIRHAVVITSGFTEIGPEGRALEASLVAAARQAGVVLLGPNTMGIANPHLRLFCTGSTVSPPAGGTSVAAQSGNMGTQLLAFAEQHDLGIRCFAGSGNEAMLTIEDYLEAFESDTLTRTIMLYVESVKHGRRFYESAARVGRQKPIVLLKGGRTAAGLQAAASHTGALASDQRVFDAMCRQAGIITAEQPMQLLDLAAAFASLPLPHGPRVAIMTWGGGWGVVTADLCQHYGLEVPPLDNGIITAIDAILPPYWSRANPVDLVGEQDFSIPLKILELLMQWPGCDAVIILGILGRRQFFGRLAAMVAKADPTISKAYLDEVDRAMQGFEADVIQQTTDLMARYRKPIVGVSLLSGAESRTIRRTAGAPYPAVFYETPERAVRVISKMTTYKRFLAAADRGV